MCRTDRGWEAVGAVAALVIQKVAGRAETGMALNPPMRSEAGRERETQPSAALDESSRLRALGPAMRNTPEPTPVTIRTRVISHPVALGRGGNTVGRVLEKVRADAQNGGEFRVGPRAGGGIARDAENLQTDGACTNWRSRHAPPNVSSQVNYGLNRNSFNKRTGYAVHAFRAGARN